MSPGNLASRTIVAPFCIRKCPAALNFGFKTNALVAGLMMKLTVQTGAVCCHLRKVRSVRWTVTTANPDGLVPAGTILDLSRLVVSESLKGRNRLCV